VGISAQYWIQQTSDARKPSKPGPDTERRLRRAILGYYREDLYLVPPTGFDGSGDDDNSPDMTP